MAHAQTNILHRFEIDHYIEELECINMEEMLSPRWVVCGCRLVQLGVQAALETTHTTHDYVQDALTLHHKGLTVVWHLLTTEAWRLNVLPLLLSRRQLVPSSSLPFVMVLQTEAAVLGLLENLVYHEDSAAALDGLALDVIDYSVRQLNRMAAHAHAHPHQPLLYEPQESWTASPALADKTPEMRGTGETGGGEVEGGESESEEKQDSIVREVSREERRVGLVLACRAAAVIQLLACCRRRLPLCATTRLLHTHDVPQLLASLLHLAPWRTLHNGHNYVFQEGQWVEQGDAAPLTPTECQLWTALYSLLMDRETLAMYEVSSGRRTALLKLRGRLSAAALAQVPALEPLARWLAALALTAPQQARPPPLVTTIAQLGGGVAGMWEGRWGELADLLEARFLTPTPEALKALATNLAAAWDLDALEALLPDTPACASCGSPAGRRCSKCRAQWYCRRECQVKHWPDHKKLCDLLTSDPRARKTTFIQ
nr:zinc finger MYND domain-containing protein 10-like [Procambarus clarkii]